MTLVQQARLLPKTHQDYLAQRRFAVLDGVRAMSILLVFTAHPAYQEFWGRFNGGTGVTVFFVLSGFLITSLLLRERDRNGRVDLRAFYLRRTFRIYPLFFAVLLLYCILILGLGFESGRRDVFLSHLPQFVFWFPEGTFINRGGLTVPYDGSWSIGIEEKFYLVWPVLGFVLLLGRPRLRLVVLAVASVAFTTASLFAGWPQFLAPYAHITYGAIVAVLLHHRRSYAVLSQMGRPPILVAALSLALVLQASTPLISRTRPLYGLFGVVVALVIAGLVATSWAAPDRVLASRGLVYIGTLSYALYLLHNFGLNAAEAVVPSSWGLWGSLLSTAIGLGASVLVCHFVHRWYEEPMRRFGVRLARRRRPEATLPAVTEAEAEGRST